MSLFDQLKEIQWKQLQHDEKYHKEIWLLDVQRRSVHMVLHFAKYSGKINFAAYQKNHEELSKILIDMLIIAISMSNIFGVPLYKALRESEKTCEDIDALAKSIVKSLKKDYKGRDFENKIAMEISLTVSDMCKAVEALDHLEAFNFKDELIISCMSLFRYSIALLNHLKKELIQKAISDRLIMVEKKNLFFHEIGNYLEGYN